MSEQNTLPVVTSDDNGKLLAVVDGAWAAAYPNFPYIDGTFDSSIFYDPDVDGYTGTTIFFVPDTDIFPVFMYEDNDIPTYDYPLSKSEFESETPDLSEVPSDRYVFSEAGIPYYKCGYFWNWYIYIVSEDYEDKLVPGEGEPVSGGGSEGGPK